MPTFDRNKGTRPIKYRRVVSSRQLPFAQHLKVALPRADTQIVLVSLEYQLECARPFWDWVLPQGHGFTLSSGSRLPHWGRDHTAGFQRVCTMPTRMPAPSVPSLGAIPLASTSRAVVSAIAGAGGGVEQPEDSEDSEEFFVGAAKNTYDFDRDSVMFHSWFHCQF